MSVFGLQPTKTNKFSFFWEKIFIIFDINSSSNGKQKYNIFVEHNIDPNNIFKLTEERVAGVERQIERSLRGFAMDNRKKMKPPTTEEEKSLEILTQGQ